MVNLTSSSFPFLFLFAICGILDLASLWHPRDKTVTHTHTQEILFAGYATGTEHNADRAAISTAFMCSPNRCEPCRQRPPLDSHTWVHLQTNTSICNINTFTYRLWHIAFVIGPVSANTERDKTKHSLPHTRSTSTHLDTCAHGTCQGWITWVMRKL